MQYDVLTLGGQPYPTRYRPDTRFVTTTAAELYALPDSQLLHLIAIHEAGHAVAHLAGGRAHLLEATVCAGTHGAPGIVHAVSYDLYGPAAVIAHCAGERAVDQWLRRHGLWTVSRAVAVEISAESDRAQSLAIPGMTHARIRAMHDPTDRLLTTHWARVDAVAAALLAAGTLTGDQVAAVAGLTNPPKP